MTLRWAEFILVLNNILIYKDNCYSHVMYMIWTQLYESCRNTPNSKSEQLKKYKFSEGEGGLIRPAKILY